MIPIYNYLATGELPSNQKEANMVRRRACAYVMIEEKLYRQGFSIPLLKCGEEYKVDHILREIHEGINAKHLRGRSLAQRAMHAGYYWPTIQHDAKELVKNVTNANAMETCT